MPPLRRHRPTAPSPSTGHPSHCLWPPSTRPGEPQCLTTRVPNLFFFWLFVLATLVVRVHSLELCAACDWLACVATLGLPSACRRTTPRLQLPLCTSGYHHRDLLAMNFTFG